MKAIKPLNLAQAEASKIIDHGGAWIFKMNELRRRELSPEKVLFTVAKPESDTGSRINAYQNIVEQIQGNGLEVAEFGQKEKVMTFAKNGLTLQ